jgi:alpha-mannosidase
MPILRDSILLLPGHELEGFPRRLESSLADDLLASWLGLWHPLILRATQAIPKWQHIDRLPDQLETALLILPKFIDDQAPAERRSTWEEQGAHLFSPGGRSWPAFQTDLLQQLSLAGDELPLLAAEFRDELAALGYCYLQIQLMTRQLRYTSNLNQVLFSEQVMKAVDALLGGDRETAVRMLQSCFDTLGQERDHYYSLDVNLLDLTLLAETTLGKSFARQLQAAHPTSILASGTLLRSLHSHEPESAAKLAAMQREHQCCIVGGLDKERPHPLMPREAVVRELWRGKESFRELGYEPPKIFARMSYGLLADAASLLKRSNYTGSLLVALSGGHYPQSSQSKLSWESADGVFINAIAPPLLDAADPVSFLALGWTVGEALDHQHVPTILFAHWPAATSDYFSLVQIIASRTPALGRWRLLEEYFVDTDQPYHQERLDGDGFQYNWLTNCDQPSDLIHRVKVMHQCQARCRGLHNLLLLCYQLEQQPSNMQLAAETEEATTLAMQRATRQWSPELSKLHDLLDSLLDPDVDADAVLREFRHAADTTEQMAAAAISKRLVGRNPNKPQPGRLLINPRSTAVRWHVQQPDSGHLDAGQEWHFASGPAGSHQYAAIDVPGFGFVAAQQSNQTNERNRSAPLADAVGMLRNEFLEVQVDESRGHLRSLHIPARRGNRLSMMVAYRERAEDGSFRYSDMVASDVRMLTSSSMCGLQRAVGRLELDGTKIGNFEIDYELWRGSRILEVIVRLTDLRPASNANPWRSAYTLRLAWPTEAALLRTFHFGTRSAWGSGRAISPELIEIDETDYKTHYLPGGLAFHRRTEERFLETILACGNQTSVSHRCGIAVDLPSPLEAARSFMDKPRQISLPDIGDASSTGWLINIDVREVVCDLESPLFDASGKLVGLRLHLSETSGKSITTKLRFWRSVASAARVDHFGGTLSKLAVDDDLVTIPLRANEHVYVDVTWQI